MGRDGPQIHVALSKLLAQAGRLDDAVAELQTALRLDPSHREALRSYIPKSRTQDGLFFLAPPRVDRIPIVLVHGTASSPARWAELINELAADPRIRPPE